MADGKKISFGFSKISKKPAVVVPQKEENVQFIDCLEENSIKLVNGEENVKEALVIPLKNGNILRDNMIEALKSRKEEKGLNSLKQDSKLIVEENEKKPLTLDELAAKEILEDLKKSNESEESKDVREIPATNASTMGEKESTIEDYENVPINEFGLAMLRGMGWAPDKGIGKNGQVIQPVNPVVRPKGMGLGADKVIPTTVRSTTGEELVMKKSALLKIISGPHKNLYGKVEGFDELPGRIMVRLALQNSVISISENLVQLVTSEEYNKNSKILNLSDYNKYYEEKDSKDHLKAKTDLPSGKYPNQKNQQSNEVENSSKKGHFERSRKYDKYSTEEGKRKDVSQKDRESSSSEEEQLDEKRLHKRPQPIRENTKKSKERRRNSSSPEDRYQRHRSKRDKRSPSSSSEYEYKSSKSQKTKSRNRSSSSDYKKPKVKVKHKDKSESRSHSSHSKKKEKYKASRRDRSSSSDSENAIKSKDWKHKSEKYQRSQKHSRHDRDQTDSDSDIEEQKRTKHKSYSRKRSTSRSPSHKKKKKHYKS